MVSFKMLGGEKILSRLYLNKTGKVNFVFF